jgi:hypothetical protein
MHGRGFAVKVAASLSILAFIVVSAALGLRLLLLARTTRQAPELCMGASLVLIGGLGYPLAMLTASPAIQQTSWASWTFAACSWSVHGGVYATYLFVYLVFRRDRPLVRTTVGCVGALLVTTALWQAKVAFSDLSAEETMKANLIPSTGLLTLAVLAYLWSAVESLRYWRLMKRRVALGLADPVTTHRFLLWGLAGAAMVFSACANLLASIFSPLSVLHPAVLLVTSVCGFTNTAALILTFVPPARFVAWVRARHPVDA